MKAVLGRGKLGAQLTEGKRSRRGSWEETFPGKTCGKTEYWDGGSRMNDARALTLN